MRSKCTSEGLSVCFHMIFFNRKGRVEKKDLSVKFPSTTFKTDLDLYEEPVTPLMRQRVELFRVITFAVFKVAQLILLI